MHGLAWVQAAYRAAWQKRFQDPGLPPLAPPAPASALPKSDNGSGAEAKLDQAEVLPLQYASVLMPHGWCHSILSVELAALFPVSFNGGMALGFLRLMANSMLY